MNNFAVLNIAYYHTPTSISITITTNNPCHLTCYYTDKEPLRHRTSRNQRGLTLPWGAYYCFVAWQSVEQTEPGDTLIHTFEITPWSYCQTKWFAFRGTVAELLSPSVSCLFEHHHPGPIINQLTIPVAHVNDDYRRLDSLYQACPTVCPPILEAGYSYTHRLHIGCGLRFREVTIPQHATILQANLTFTASQEMVGSCRYTRISAEQEDNPPDFSLDDWLSATTRWQNSGTAIDWDSIPYWYLDEEYTSPDISVVIQELVNRALWAPENAMVLFFNDWDKRAGHLPYKTRRAYSYNVSPARAVKLYVKYEA